MSGNTARVILILLVVLCVVVLLAAVAVGVIMFRKQTQERVQPTQPVTEAPTEAPTETPTETPTEIPTEVPTEAPTEVPTEAPTEVHIDVSAQPAALTKWLKFSGSNFRQLEDYGCKQLVTVVSQGIKAQIAFYQLVDGQWQEVTELSCDGFVGRSGVFISKQEGDGSTPAGLYSIGSGFYIHDAPQTGLDLFQITRDTYWIDDPDSMHYNKRVEGTENKDWKSAEHMISYDVYRYGFVVDYNLMATYNAGSAIFFHIGSGSTSGCISTGEDMVLAYLARLDKTQNPYILIVPGEKL